jgi:small redox-active disulfide protein 2
MTIQVLGPGCARCKQTFQVIEEALKQLNLTADLSKVEDIREIARFRIMSTPAVVINGKVKCSGKVPSVAEVTSYITTALSDAS